MDMPLNRLKRALLQGEQQIGLWSSLCSPIAAELLSWTGYDWILFDTEHAPNEVPVIMAQLQAMEAGTASAVVRPAWNDPVLFKRLLDVGAQTLLVPFVENREEAERAVAATRYPPMGFRGVATNTRANRFGRVTSYLRECENEICVIAQLETPAALDAIPEIASVDGIDCLFIGPSDLSANMGHIGNPTHPEVVAAIDRAIKAILDAGKPAGILAPNEDLAQNCLRQGARFVAVGSDLALITRGAEQLVQRVRERSRLVIA
jgi:4-hydroxy-2-oxoheptanedioate aldolase